MLYRPKMKKENKITVEAYQVGGKEIEPPWLQDENVIEKVNNNLFKIGIYMDDWEEARTGDYILNNNGVFSIWKNESFNNHWEKIKNTDMITIDINIKHSEYYKKILEMAQITKKYLEELEKELNNLVKDVEKELKKGDEIE